MLQPRVDAELDSEVRPPAWQAGRDLVLSAEFLMRYDARAACPRTFPMGRPLFTFSLTALPSAPYSARGLLPRRQATRELRWGFLLDRVRPIDEAIGKHYGVETYSPTTEEESGHADLPRTIVFDWANASPERQRRAFELFKMNYALFRMFMNQFD